MKRQLENKNILITGGAGFIGSHLGDALSNLLIGNLIIIDNLFVGLTENLNLLSRYKKFKFFKKYIFIRNID